MLMTSYAKVLPGVGRSCREHFLIYQLALRESPCQFVQPWAGQDLEIGLLELPEQRSPSTLVVTSWTHLA